MLFWDASKQAGPRFQTGKGSSMPVASLLTPLQDFIPVLVEASGDQAVRQMANLPGHQ